MQSPGNGPGGDTAVWPLYSGLSAREGGREGGAALILATDPVSALNLFVAFLTSAACITRVSAATRLWHRAGSGLAAEPSALRIYHL